MSLMSLATLLGLLAMAHAAPYSAIPPSAASKCPHFNGTFSIETYRLYSKNLDWDSVKLQATSDTEPFHESGINYDASTKSIVIQANSGTPFVTNGTDISGPNQVIRYDTTITGSMSGTCKVTQ
ncbi:hypothetical protein F5883DRAFT_520750 [Diaporthe sp. PMI_573]|nr:hypothetical protein F5883DRAFT_520750 [Diaporthaceae sp. PMI_573]